MSSAGAGFVLLPRRHQRVGDREEPELVEIGVRGSNFGDAMLPPQGRGVQIMEDAGALSQTAIPSCFAAPDKGLSRVHKER